MFQSVWRSDRRRLTKADGSASGAPSLKKRSAPFLKAACKPPRGKRRKRRLHGQKETEFAGDLALAVERHAVERAQAAGVALFDVTGERPLQAVIEPMARRGPEPRCTRAREPAIPVALCRAASPPMTADPSDPIRCVETLVESAVGDRFSWPSRLDDPNVDTALQKMRG